MIINWRPYQLECLEQIKKKKKKVKRQLIVAATGVGKRLLAVGISKDYNRTLFLCHREELIDQAFRDFNRMYPMDVGIVKGPVFEINKRIVIGSAQTMWRRLDRIPQDHFDCVMCDEAHHFLAKTFIQPLSFFTYKNSFGFTATPTRLDGLDFTNIMDEIVYEYPINRAIKDGWLCQIEAHRVQTQIDISKVKRIGGDFSQSELSPKIDIPERNNLVAQKYRKYAFGRQALVFCCDIAHAENMAEMFRANGLIAKAIHSEMDHHDRQQSIANFRNKIIDVLTNVDILCEGFDYEDIGCVCMARPTQSLALYCQQIGRGTRLKSESFREKHMANNCIILDFVDNTGNHKLVNTWTLDQDKKAEDKVFVTDEQRQKFLDHESEAMRQLEFAEMQQKRIRDFRIMRFYKHDKPVDLLDLPTLKVNHRGRMLEDAAPKQIEWLQNLGVWQPGINYTKAQASEYITHAPAPDWMYQKLANWGYNIVDGATIGQYYEIKKRIEAEARGESREKFEPVNISKI
jgi:superfamily II DNA or RNA helicase